MQAIFNSPFNTNLLFPIVFWVALSILLNFYEQEPQNQLSENNKTFLMYFIRNFFKYLILAKILISIFCSVLNDISSINIYKIYQQLPLSSSIFLLVCYWIIVGRYAYHTTCTLKTHLFLSLIKFKNANPLNTYNYYLIDYKNIKETLKHRLSVLQSYSLIPVFLLVANNLTSCSINNLSFQNLDIKSIIDSNSTNIVLIFILLFYLYILVSTLRNYEKICHNISLLERYIFELNHPGISLEKKPDILIKSDKHSDSLQQ